MNRFRHGITLLVIAILISAYGCAPIQPRITYNPSNPVKTVAVLPVLNHTNDVEAPEKIREEFEKRLAYMGYKSMPLVEVNNTLKNELGITLGKQLDMTNPVELGQKLGVDAVIYGTLFDHDEKTTGVLDIRRIKVGFKMVVARDLTSENLSAFANLQEAISKSWLETLKAAIEYIDAEEKAGKMTKEQANTAREDLKKSYNITHLDITKLSPPQVVLGKAGTTFWAAGSAVKGTTKITGGIAGLVAKGASLLSAWSDFNDMKNAKDMSEFPGINKWIELQPIEKDMGLGMSVLTSIGKKTLGKAFGSFLKAESDEAIREIYKTVPVGPGL